jgi:uncharacterized protein (DUF2147 family)
MRTLFIVAALALIGTSAEAKVHDLKFGGRHVRIEVPKRCKNLSCIRVSGVDLGGGKAGKAIDSAVGTTTGAAAGSAVAAGATLSRTAPVPAPSQDNARIPTPSVSTSSSSAPSSAPQVGFTGRVESRSEPRIESRSEPQADDRKSLARLSLPANPAAEDSGPAAEGSRPAAEGSRPAANAVTVNAPAASPTGTDDTQPAKAEAPSPVGVWLTQKRESRIRVEACGQALCGFVDGKPSEKVLINMKPASNNRWNGKINDLRSGGTYMANITLKGANSLRVEGCAFGGLFCGGETWTRVE